MVLLKILNDGEPLLFINNSNLGEFIAAAGLLILFSPAWPWNCTYDLQNVRAPFQCPPGCFVHHFIAMCALKLDFGEPGNPVTLKLDGWHWKTKGHLFYSPPSVGLNFIASYAGTETGVIVWKRWNRGQFGDFFSPVAFKLDRWPWKTTGRLFYAPQLCVSFHGNLCNETGVIVRKQSYLGKIYVDSCDLELWPPILTIFQWYLLLHDDMMKRILLNYQHHVQWMSSTFLKLNSQ